MLHVQIVIMDEKVRKELETNVFDSLGVGDIAQKITEFENAGFKKEARFVGLVKDRDENGIKEALHNISNIEVTLGEAQAIRGSFPLSKFFILTAYECYL